tara:strand:- start:2177 stop:2455 length:279 start_codon:yes stop_codon:yes gene_type:complete
MELTRRQFIISSSAAASVIAVPSIFISSAEEINYKINKFKSYTYEQFQSLDKYITSSMIPSLMASLILADTLELLHLVSLTLISIISIVILL